MFFTLRVNLPSTSSDESFEQEILLRVTLDSLIRPVNVFLLTFDLLCSYRGGHKAADRAARCQRVSVHREEEHCQAGMEVEFL